MGESSWGGAAGPFGGPLARHLLPSSTVPTPSRRPPAQPPDVGKGGLGEVGVGVAVHVCVGVKQPHCKWVTTATSGWVTRHRWVTKGLCRGWGCGWVQPTHSAAVHPQYTRSTHCSSTQGTLTVESQPDRACHDDVSYRPDFLCRSVPGIRARIGGHNQGRAGQAGRQADRRTAAEGSADASPPLQLLPSALSGRLERCSAPASALASTLQTCFEDVPLSVLGREPVPAAPHTGDLHSGRGAIGCGCR